MVKGHQLQSKNVGERCLVTTVMKNSGIASWRNIYRKFTVSPTCTHVATVRRCLTHGDCIPLTCDTSMMTKRPLNAHFVTMHMSCMNLWRDITASTTKSWHSHVMNAANRLQRKLLWKDTKLFTQVHVWFFMHLLCYNHLASIIKFILITSTWFWKLYSDWYYCTTCIT